MADAFAQEMVTLYQGILREAAGLMTTVVDGVTVSVTDLETKLAFWERKLARSNGSKPRVTTISLRRS